MVAAFRVDLLTPDAVAAGIWKPLSEESIPS